MTPAEQNLEKVLVILRAFAPEILGRARGLDEPEIVALERDIQRSLTSGHRAFLRAFGGNTKGTLNPFMYDFEFDAGSVRRHHDDMTRWGMPIPQDWTFVTMMGATPCPYYLYTLGPDSDPPIGMPEYDHDSETWTDRVHILDESFYNELVNVAFVATLMQKQENTTLHGWLWEGHSIPLDSTEHHLDAVAMLLVKLGFEPLVQIAGRERILRRGPEAISLSRNGLPPEFGAWSTAITGPDAKSVREVYEILADNVGLKDHRVKT